MTPLKITTDEEFDAATRELTTVWEAAPGTPEAARRATLIEAIHAYDETHYPVPEPSVADRIGFVRNEIAAAEQFLATLPASRVVERHGFEQILRRRQAELAELEALKS